MTLFVPRFGTSESQKEYDVVIIGGGPAGLSAAIYAKRAGLSTVVLEKNLGGGLVDENPLVENYLGFRSIKGSDLARTFKEHALDYVEIFEMEEVTAVEPHGEGRYLVKTKNREYLAQAVIFATGTTHKHLNIPGEREYYGKGVSYCVTCDGYAFKGKPVVIIGGGNSGAIAALTMRELTDQVEIIEYMDRWMCEDAYRKKIQDLDIPYHQNSMATEIVGDGEKVVAVRVKNRSSGEVREIPAEGVFIYVGLVPQSSVAKALGVQVDEKGYIQVDRHQRTNLPRVYAAGDITGGYAQIAVAVGQGATAALAAYEDLRLKS